MPSDPDGAYPGTPRRLILLSLVLAAAAAAPGASVAQDPDLPPPPSIVLDIGTADDRMTVPVSIGTKGPFAFVVDTGAQRTVISRELAGTLGLAAGRNVRLTAMTGTTNVETVVIPKISVSTIGASSIEAPSLESRNLGAPGMLGLDTLQGHALTIDFGKQTMTLTPSVKRQHYISPMRDEIVVHGKNIYGQLIVSDASYRGRRIRVILDTGSGVTMGNLALKQQVARGTKKVRPIALWGVTGESMQVEYTQIDQVQFAGVTFSQLPVAFSDAEPFRHFGLTKQPALLLGMDALRLFQRVRIDFPNREVRLMLDKGRAGTPPSLPAGSIPFGH